MFDQLTSASRRAPFLNSLYEPGVVFQHLIDRLLHELRGILAAAGGELKESSFLLCGEM